MSHHKPLLLLVDDQPSNLDILVDYLQDAGLDLAVSTSGDDALALTASRRPSLILLDIMMPGMDGYQVCSTLKSQPATRDIPVIFLSARDDLDSKVKGFAAGAVDYVTKPLQREEVLARVHTHLTLRQQQLLLEEKNGALETLNQQLREQIDQRETAETALHQLGEQLSALTRTEARRWGIDAFIGNSEPTLAVLSEIRNLQSVGKTPVLILGESGTGKELVSRAIHFGSDRSSRPFVAVNCAAIPHDLADAELFGHVKGAFTGASQDRLGYFAQADGGTLFLDEIGDMPLALQAKLLRVLENGEVTPVGASRTRKVDVRVVSATNIALQSKVQNQQFRQDLYYRLAGYTIQLPPLRLRRDDIPLLAQHFLKELGLQMGRENNDITADAMHRLRQHDFPGNIRELRNIIEYALISSRGAPIERQHLHFLSQADGSDDHATTPTGIANRSAITSAAIASKQRDNSEDVLIDYVERHQRIDNSIAQQLLDVPHSRASYVLKKLLREGRLARHGERRWAYYTLP